MFLRYGTLEKTFKLVSLFSLLLSVMSVSALAKSAVSISPVSVLAFGDSLTAGYELPPSDSFPAQLQTALRKKGIAATVHNAGVSGDTTTGGKARLAWVLKGQKQKPDVVILELGANDSLRGINPDITRANLDEMLVILKKSGIKVILAGMLAPPNLGADYAKKYNSIFPDLAKKHGVLLYPFFMDGVVLHPKLQLSDGMHPNKKGVGVIVDKMMPMIMSALPKK
jgi:acyl-CoA thioesterase I